MASPLRLTVMFCHPWAQTCAGAVPRAVNSTARHVTAKATRRVGRMPQPICSMTTQSARVARAGVRLTFEYPSLRTAVNPSVVAKSIGQTLSDSASRRRCGVCYGRTLRTGAENWRSTSRLRRRAARGCPRKGAYGRITVWCGYCVGESTMIRVMIADDHMMFREMLGIALPRHDDIEVVGETDNGRDLIGVMYRCRPEV